jgi:hypothetical protein
LISATNASNNATISASVTWGCIGIIINRISPSPTMSGPSSLFSDAFLNDGYNIPYNGIPHVSQPECNIMNCAHASEVSPVVFL